MNTEQQTGANVGEALRRVLADRPEGGDETAIIAALTAAGASAQVVTSVIESYVTTGWLARRAGRLYFVV
jgi:hypothetical protein